MPPGPCLMSVGEDLKSHPLLIARHHNSCVNYDGFNTTLSMQLRFLELVNQTDVEISYLFWLVSDPSSVEPRLNYDAA